MTKNMVGNIGGERKRKTYNYSLDLIFKIATLIMF